MTHRNINEAVAAPRRPSVIPAKGCYEDKLVTKEELATRLNLPSVAIVETLVRKRAIPVIRLGYKTVRFDFAKVRAALEKLTVREVGA